MIDLASVEARNRYPRHEGLQRAFVRGAQAQLARQPMDECPYGRRDRRRAQGWSRVWRSAWIGGWAWAKKRP